MNYRRSYGKTVIASGTVLVSSAAVALALVVAHRWTGAIGLAHLALDAAAVMPAAGMWLWCTLVFAGGLIALRRDRLETAGLPYHARVPRESRPGAFGALARALFRVGRSGRSLHLRPGEQVEVRELDEILATLDADGTLDGLPFMPEMAAYCGQRATVFRRVDKLNDWVRHTGLKRIRNTVQLNDGRCTGAAHGGCQANCRLRWKEAWLRRSGRSAGLAEAGGAQARLAEADIIRLAQREEPDGRVRYVCQATELAAGGEPLAWGDPRHFARDWITGNIRLRPLLTGMAIACFNWVQKVRGGVGFPFTAPSESKTSPTAVLGLRPGEIVRVKSKSSILQTLNDRNKNRGLWFDAEMLRFCGGEYRVRAVLDRVMVESTGVLRMLSTPCIVLEGVRATGEYRGFNPEDEHIFWREIWLERVQSGSES